MSLNWKLYIQAFIELDLPVELAPGQCQVVSFFDNPTTSTARRRDEERAHPVVGVKVEKALETISAAKKEVGGPDDDSKTWTCT